MSEHMHNPNPEAGRFEADPAVIEAHLQEHDRLAKEIELYTKLVDRNNPTSMKGYEYGQQLLADMEARPTHDFILDHNLEASAPDMLPTPYTVLRKRTDAREQNDKTFLMDTVDASNNHAGVLTESLDEYGKDLTDKQVVELLRSAQMASDAEAAGAITEYLGKRLAGPDASRHERTNAIIKAQKHYDAIDERKRAVEAQKAARLASNNEKVEAKIEDTPQVEAEPDVETSEEDAKKAAADAARDAIAAARDLVAHSKSAKSKTAEDRARETAQANARAAQQAAPGTPRQRRSASRPQSTISAPSTTVTSAEKPNRPGEEDAPYEVFLDSLDTDQKKTDALAVFKHINNFNNGDFVDLDDFFKNEATNMTLSPEEMNQLFESLYQDQLISVPMNKGGKRGFILRPNQPEADQDQQAAPAAPAAPAAEADEWAKIAAQADALQAKWDAILATPEPVTRTPKPPVQPAQAPRPRPGNSQPQPAAPAAPAPVAAPKRKKAKKQSALDKLANSGFKWQVGAEAKADEAAHLAGYEADVKEVESRHRTKIGRKLARLAFDNAADNPRTATFQINGGLPVTVTTEKRRRRLPVAPAPEKDAVDEELDAILTEEENKQNNSSRRGLARRIIGRGKRRGEEAKSARSGESQKSAEAEGGEQSFEERLPAASTESLNRYNNSLEEYKTGLLEQLTEGTLTPEQEQDVRDKYRQAVMYQLSINAELAKRPEREELIPLS